MAILSRSQLFAAVLFFCLLSQAIGHSYLTSPISRSNQAQSQTGCRGSSCMGPCDIPLAKATRAPIVAARGDSIIVQWPRNNHAGGFVRFAWAPTSLSDSHAAFDSHVQQINCHEIGNPTPGQCAPSDPINDPNGGGSGPGDGSFGACNVAIKVPLDLADGTWTLQWAWFGGAFSLGDYYSCVDYKIAGGPVGLMTPVFIGGDFSYPGQQKCKFFNTDKLHVCTNEPCQAPIYSGPQSGAPAAGQLGLGISIIGSTVTIPVTIPSTVPVSVPLSNPAPIIPASVPASKPATTGVKPATTGSKPVAITSGSKAATTGASPMTSASAARPVSPSISPAPSSIDILSCLSGSFKCLTSESYSTCINGAWGVSQSCGVGRTCTPVGTAIYCE